MTQLNVEILKKLGALTKKIRSEVSEIPKVGVDITEIINYVEKRIFDEGYIPAFPCTVSVNEIAAHYTVFDEGEQEIYSSIYKYEHTGWLPGYQSFATYHKDLDVVVIQFYSTTDPKLYNWNLSEIINNRIIKILIR